MTDIDQMVEALKATLSSLEAKKHANHNITSHTTPTNNGPIRALSQLDYQQIAKDYIEFTYNNPTVYHVVKSFSQDLTKAGFSYIAEKDSWTDLKPGKYFTTRNGTSLIAFIVGSNWHPSKGAGIIGSHVDSLTVLVKPNSIKSKVDGYELLGVANYAGALSNLWWDRDLGVGGRLIVKQSDGQVTSKLVDSTPHPIARIPTLAPHFGTPSQGPFNPETQAVPVIGFTSEEESPATDDEKSSPLYGKHSLNLLRYLAKLANVAVKDIQQVDLQLFDVQKGTLGGLNHEFIFAPRIDDRICSYAAIQSLIKSSAYDNVTSDLFSIVGLFDHEEVGSGTRTGIKGGLTESVISRVAASSYFNAATAEDLRLIYANSIILSADVNHLVNPNFDSVYLEHHKPIPNKGLTLALDPNGHFATDSIGVALLEELARLNDDKLQYFQIRNDSRSGSSIGPSVSSQTGARTIDIGIPQLSMHSIRATAGTNDIGLGIKFFVGFFKNWRSTYDHYNDL